MSFGGPRNTLIGTAEAVFKCNTIKPRVAESAYDPGCIDYITVAYNDFVLAGAKSQGAKLRFADPDMPVTARMPATRAGPEFVPRRVYLKPDDFVKHGFTVSCPGCTWLQNGLGARRGHSEPCRLRMEKSLADDGDDKHRIMINKSKIDTYVAAEDEKTLKDALDCQMDDEPNDNMAGRVDL